MFKVADLGIALFVFDAPSLRNLREYPYNISRN